jgi:outer membrane receptor protein involved in Fe transport
MVDGARVGPAGAPGSSGVATFATALPARGMSAVSVGGMGFDVEAGGSGVGINALSLRGGALPSSRSAVFGGTTDVWRCVRGRRNLQRDSAYGVFGVDYQRSEVAGPAWFDATDAEGRALMDIARDSFATSLAGYGVATPRLEERASAFGRLDWQVGDRYAIAFRAAGTRLTSEDSPSLGGRIGGLGSRHEATSAQAALNVVARLTRRVSAEFRLSGDVARVQADGPRIAPTAFAGRGTSLGGALDEPFSDARATPRLSGMLHWDVGTHRFKVGAVVASHRYETEGAFGQSGAYRFGDAEDFAVGSGAWRGVAAGVSSGSFRMTERAFFLQDTWSVTDGLSVVAGVRFDANRLPLGQITPNAPWLASSGIDNTAPTRSQRRTAPRIGFRWELGNAREWVLDGGAGVYNDLPDRRDIGEALALDLGADVRGAVGTFTGWPLAPDVATAPIWDALFHSLGQTSKDLARAG